MGVQAKIAISHFKTQHLGYSQILLFNKKKEQNYTIRSTSFFTIQPTLVL